MDDTKVLRASDRDRDEVVDRLRTAMVDGRLTPEEYADRAGLAYQATTYGDLAKLHADLPAAVHVLAPGLTEPSEAPGRPRSLAGTFARLPVLLKVLWAIWMVSVSVNVVVWALVSVTTRGLLYPWPLWVAGPFGASLLAASIVVMQCRGSAKP